MVCVTILVKCIGKWSVTSCYFEPWDHRGSQYVKSGGHLYPPTILTREVYKETHPPSSPTHPQKTCPVEIMPQRTHTSPPSHSQAWNSLVIQLPLSRYKLRYSPDVIHLIVLCRWLLLHRTVNLGSDFLNHHFVLLSTCLNLKGSLMLLGAPQQILGLTPLRYPPIHCYSSKHHPHLAMGQVGSLGNPSTEHSK